MALCSLEIALADVCALPYFFNMIQAHPWADGDSQRFFEACYEGTFRQAVTAYCRHRRMGARRFADAALGKGGLQFIRPYRGRSIRLATADKVLRFMDEPRFGPLFRREVEAFLAVTGTKAYLLGEMAVGDPSFVTRLPEDNDEGAAGGARAPEPAEAYMETTRAHLAAHGRPVAYYSDRYGVFRVNKKGREAEPTQFTRALKTLDIEAGNAYLPEFMADFNRRFAVAPRNPQDAHREVLHDAAELDLIFREHHGRKLTKNLTIRFECREYQVTGRGKGYRLRGAAVTVCKAFDGSVTVLRKGRELAVRLLAEGEEAVAVQDEKTVRRRVDRAKAEQQSRPAYKPAPDHPWRRALKPGATSVAAG